MRPGPVLLVRLFVMTCICLPGVAFAGTGLPAEIARVLDWQQLPRESVSIWVQRPGDPEPELSHNADVPRNPASVIKLFTTFAALAELGPAYRWRTEVFVEEVAEDGRVRDLWLRGGGDPYLLDEDLWRLAAAIRRAGVSDIDGDLVLDTSYYAIEPEDPGAFDDRPWRAYNQPPHSLLINFNAMRFHLRPDPASGAVEIHPDPPLPGLEVENRIRLRDGACGGFQRGVSYHVPDTRRVRFEGEYPAGCDDDFRLVRRAVGAEDYLTGLFSLVWQQWGGGFSGDWRHGRWIDDAATPLVVHESRPLGEVIRFVNKYSSNVMARQVKLALGSEVHGPPATLEKGNLAILQILEARGIDTREIHLDNAAGLSRTNRVSARQVADLLAAARRGPYMPEFISSLAIAGLDGTARRRFADGPAAGRMRLKTGRLNDVSAVAGYVRAADDAEYLVVVLVNAGDAHLGKGNAVQDAVLQWVFSRGDQAG